MIFAHLNASLRIAAHSERRITAGFRFCRDIQQLLRYELFNKKEVMDMELDAKIARVKALIAKREELDAEISELLGGTVRERRSPKCSACGEPGHRVTTCPSKPAEPAAA